MVFCRNYRFFSTFSFKIPISSYRKFRGFPILRVFSTTTRYDPSADSTVKSSKKRKFSESSSVGSGRSPATMNEDENRTINKDGQPQKKHRKKKV